MAEHHLYQKDEIKVLWHLGFHDGMLTGVAELVNGGQKVYLDCTEDGGWGPTVKESADEYPPKIKDYMDDQGLTHFKDFPEEVSLEDCFLFRWDPEDSDSGEYEIEVCYKRKYAVYEFPSYEGELTRHKIFQQYAGYHTDYPRGETKYDYLKNPEVMGDFKRDWNTMKQEMANLNYKFERGKLLGYVYHSELKTK